MSYYRIIPVTSIGHGIFDTITEVSKATGRQYGEIMQAMGFESNGDFLRYCNQNPDPKFNKSAFAARRLNHICRELHAPIRVIRPIAERSRNEY